MSVIWGIIVLKGIITIKISIFISLVRLCQFKVYF